MQTIPLKFGEQIYFFPLGSDGGRNSGIVTGDPHIELLIELRRYDEAAQNSPEPEQDAEESADLQPGSEN